VGNATIANDEAIAGTYSNWAIATFVFSGLFDLVFLRSLLDLAMRDRLDRFADR
jgi:hypothetical protein